MCADFIGVGLGKEAMRGSQSKEELSSRMSQATRQTLSSWTGLCRIQGGASGVGDPVCKSVGT